MTPRPASAIPASDRLRAKEIAALEDCSISTAGDLIRSGKLGPVYGRNRRNRWVDRRAYQTWIDLPADSQKSAGQTPGHAPTETIL